MDGRYINPTWNDVALKNFLNLRAGDVRNAGLGYSVVLPDFDFETYSEAGFVWNPQTSRWGGLHGGGNVKGLPVVGTAAYSEHPSVEVLSMAYDLKNGDGPKLWRPGLPLPMDLFKHLMNGGLLEAWNASFEKWIWNNVCIQKYGFPPLPSRQVRCAMAKARAFALPGRLAEASKVLNTGVDKDSRGKRLLDKFSKPRQPTKYNNSLRNLVVGDVDENDLYQYNLQDIVVEARISALVPDLSASELQFWFCDQDINTRGVQIDVEAIKACIHIVDEAHKKYNQELCVLTDFTIERVSEIAKMVKWLRTEGLDVGSLDAESIENLLKDDKQNLSPKARRLLEIREIMGSAAVKKLYSMTNQVSRRGRLHDLFIYHSARTGRAAGAGPQPQNLPNSGPELAACSNCKKHFKNMGLCPWCGSNQINTKDVEWNPEAVEDALQVIKTKSLSLVEYHFQDALSVVSGCLRGMFIAAPGHELICSDYSAIEAVVLAALSDEQWRLEVFKTHGKIYEMSASKITGIPFEQFEQHRIEHGQHHPMRKKVGKVAELASGYQGWIGAWKAFGADEFFSDEEIKNAILAWRNASPNIVKMWGGQFKNYRPDYFGLEGAAIQAVMNPGTVYGFREIQYVTIDNVLYCRLPSGRHIAYHNPKINAAVAPRLGVSLSFEGWNTNPKYGKIGWVRMSTYGGKLTENVVQAVARDILANAIVNLEAIGYKVVLHVHDEIVVEMPIGEGSVQELERVMSTMPHWAKGWPLVAKGGWKGHRYRK